MQIVVEIDVNRRRHLDMLWGFMKVVDIYINLTGRHCKLQRTFTSFVAKFCNGRHLAMSCGFTKVVDIYINCSGH